MSFREGQFASSSPFAFFPYDLSSSSAGGVTVSSTDSPCHQQRRECHARALFASQQRFHYGRADRQTRRELVGQKRGHWIHLEAAPASVRRHAEIEARQHESLGFRELAASLGKGIGHGRRQVPRAFVLEAVVNAGARHLAREGG